ncbi:c-type cytochrome [Rubrivivax gelatinosus]|uniref:c-type cytochrome n=1 Tax=Rubrivivax gelatinosus TaxID=28068 RepID=UPI001A359E97|nr:c-type cytochrome [Rubrivivax gelatinosus]MBG6082078.1 cytochrome c [Rubrivivax gelatinosus]
MTAHSRHPRRAAALVLITGLGLAAPAFALDEGAAEALVRRNNCLKCHGVDKDKDGPSFQKTARKYRGKAGAVDRVVEHLTSGEKAKFPDGHEEDHKIVRAERADLENLAQWILSR